MSTETVERWFETAMWLGFFLLFVFGIVMSFHDPAPEPSLPAVTDTDLTVPVYIDPQGRTVVILPDGRYVLGRITLSGEATE